MVTISSSTPGCIIFLIDRSSSMGRTISRSRGETLAMRAARLVNAALLHIVGMSTKVVGGSPRNYFYIGVYGYGLVPKTGREGVTSSLGEGIPSDGIFELQQVAKMVIRSGIRASDVAPDIGAPVWVEAAHGCQAPICRAIARVEGPVLAWSARHPHSPPPVIVNVTDGLITNDSFEGADLSEWYSRLGRISTDLGVVKVFDAVVSTENDPVTLRPATPAALIDPGWTIVEVAELLHSVEIEIRTWASCEMIAADQTQAVSEPPCEAE